MRLFIALPLEQSVKTSLGSIISDLKPHGGSVKWVKPDNIHMTLRFLGETEEKTAGKLKAVIDEVAGGHHRVETSIGKLGGFPNLNRPRVIWVGMEQQVDYLAKIARQLELKVRTLRFEKETKPFKAHLTLARIRDPHGLDELVDSLKDYHFDEIPVRFDRIVLFKSTLTPQGPIYDRLHEAELLPQ